MSVKTSSRVFKCSRIWMHGVSFSFSFLPPFRVLSLVLPYTEQLGWIQILKGIKVEQLNCLTVFLFSFFLSVTKYLAQGCAHRRSVFWYWVPSQLFLWLWKWHLSKHCRMALNSCSPSTWNPPASGSGATRLSGPHYHTWFRFKVPSPEFQTLEFFSVEMFLVLTRRLKVDPTCFSVETLKISYRLCV